MNTLDLLTFFFIAFVLRAVPIPQIRLWNLRRSRMGLMKEMEGAEESKALTKVCKRGAISLFARSIGPKSSSEDEIRAST
jgi:hypothetical protein